MVDWVEAGLETLGFEENPTEVAAFHPLVLVHVLGTHRPSGRLKHLLSVLSGVMGKNFTKKPRDKVQLLAEAWSC